MKTGKKTLALLLAATFLLGMAPLTRAEDNAYSDVPPAHWAYDVITKWSGDGYGVLSGNGDGTFSPNEGLLLGELAAILSKTFGYTERVPADVTPAWAKEHVEKAIAAGVIEKADEIDADAPVTREQAIKTIALAYNIKPVEGETTFADNGLIGAEYKPYVNAFQKLSYVVGDNADPAKSKFNPQSKYLRAEAMAVINNSTSEILDGSAGGQTYAKNLIIRKPDVTVKDTTVEGNLIIGQGVGDGEVTLDNVTVKGALVVYGGGSNSIIISGGSQIAYAVINKQGGEPANIRVEDGSRVTAVEVNAGSSAKITGSVAEVSVSANATLEIAEGSFVERIEIDGEKVTIYVNDGATVQRITIEGDDVVVQGQGKVDAVVVNAGEGVEIDTKGTTVTNEGAGTVKTGEGEVAPGETATTAPEDPEPAAPTTPTTPTTPTSPSPSPGRPSTVTVNTIAELRDALDNTAITTVNVAVTLQNNSETITVPAGKTVVFAKNTGLRVSELTVNGTLAGDTGVVIFVGSAKLSGTGLNAGNENGFFGTGAAYKPRFWMWYAAGGTVETTGFWPTSVTVYYEAALTEACLVSTITEVHLEDTFSITKDFSRPYVHVSGKITIDAGVTVTATSIMIWNSLTVDGTLTGNTIYLYGDKLELDGETYYGPDNRYFSSSTARRFQWDTSAGEWDDPELYDVDYGVTYGGAGSSARDLDKLKEMLEVYAKYPELSQVRINSSGEETMTFDEDYTFALTIFTINLIGDYTYDDFGDTYTCEPVTVGAGVTLTIGAGVELNFLSDDGTNGIVGVDATSTIIVETGAVVKSIYEDNWNPVVLSTWTAGTYEWNPATEEWDKQ